MYRTGSVEHTQLSIMWSVHFVVLFVIVTVECLLFSELRPPTMHLVETQQQDLFDETRHVMDELKCPNDSQKSCQTWIQCLQDSFALMTVNCSALKCKTFLWNIHYYICRLCRQEITPIPANTDNKLWQFVVQRALGMMHCGKIECSFKHLWFVQHNYYYDKKMFGMKQCICLWRCIYILMVHISVINRQAIILCWHVCVCYWVLFSKATLSW